MNLGDKVFTWCLLAVAALWLGWEVVRLFRKGR